MFFTRARATRIAHMLPTTGSMRMFRGKQVRVPTSGTPKVDLFGLHEDELRENHRKLRRKSMAPRVGCTLCLNGGLCIQCTHRKGDLSLPPRDMSNI